MAARRFASRFLFPSASDFHMPWCPKLQRAGALQDASRHPSATFKRGSVFDCSGPPPPFIGDGLCISGGLLPTKPPHFI